MVSLGIIESQTQILLINIFSIKTNVFQWKNLIFAKLKLRSYLGRFLSNKKLFLQTGKYGL